ncbi:MAG TPA: phage holin family protein [Caulobacteraceae bacterium]|jgi:putative membrane protein|nr:phage holin family protein [Caulobacteraceae bacterium]
MVRFILRALVSALGFWLAAKIVKGVHVEGWQALILAGLALGIANAFVRPILTFFTLPLTIVTLGLFLIVVNALMVKLVDWVIPGIRIEGLLAAIFTTIVIWFTSLVANAVFGGELNERSRAD